VVPRRSALIRAPRPGEETLLHIHFESDGRPNSAQLGATSSKISYTSSGPTGSAGITIDSDNVLFVDRYRESLPIQVHGIWDLIAVLAHEIGHGLGLEHPPIDPATGEIESGLMSPVEGDQNVKRQLYPYDIRNVQQLWGAIRPAGTVSANLPEAVLIDASPGVQLQTAGPGLVVSGPASGPAPSRAVLDVLVSAKNSSPNALHLEFTTVTKNVFVNRVETFDGIVPLQQFAISARNSGDEGLAGKSWDLRLGFLSRRQLTNNMLVRLELFFTKNDGQPQFDFGVLQLAGVAAETLPPPFHFLGPMPGETLHEHY
jgi:Matrixin